MKSPLRFLLFVLALSSPAFSQAAQIVGERPSHLSFHPNGPVGLFRLYSAERVPHGPLSLGLGLSANYLRLDDFPSSGIDTRRLAGGASLSWTPGEDFEIFASGFALTTNRTAAEGSIQQVGNARFGAKWAHDFNDAFSFGALYEGDLRQPYYDRNLDAYSLSHTTYLVSTIRFGIPLKILLNAGYRVDDTDDLVHPALTDQEAIVLNLFGHDAIVGGAGLEVPLRRVSLSLEYSTEQTLDSAGIGYWDNPQRATVGFRYFPEGNPHWALGLAGDIGYFATRDKSTRLRKEPDYSFLASMTYFVGKPAERAPAPVAPAAGPKTSIVIGTVKDAKTGTPVGGARISFCGNSTSALVSDEAAGLFKSYDLPQGECEIKVAHPDFQPYQAKLQIAGPEVTQDIPLERAGPAQGYLSLSVKDTDDRALRAEVAFPEIPAAKPVATSEQGKIRMKLPEGKYIVEVRAPGKKSEQKIFEIVAGADATGDYVLASGSARLEDQRIVITRQVQFAPGKAEIKEESKLILDEVASILNQHAEVKRLEVGGYTDAMGSPAINKRLSSRRAQAVVQYLVSVGVARARLVAVGYGQEKPIASNATPEGRVANRRVEFRVLR